jgi:uncharacterized protein
MSETTRHGATARTGRTQAEAQTRGPGLWIYLLLGIAFGFILTKSEVISWFRIQEMFRFQGFHMYGIFATALAVAIPSIALLKRSQRRTLGGEPVNVPDKDPRQVRRYALGGMTFGVGWAFTGACPGPFFALIGSGIGVMAVAVLSALAGTWVYGWMRPRLPH